MGGVERERERERKLHRRKVEQMFRVWLPNFIVLAVAGLHVE